MARYRHYDPQQAKMIAVSYDRQLLPGTFEHALSYLIDNEIDLGRFAARFKNDETGAPAYDPAVLLKVVLFAYSRGITSSRTMARACAENVVFIALACDQQPHFTTLAHFVTTLGTEVEAVFRDVLMVCNRQGLIGKNMFAIDGCKLPSNASKEWSGTSADFERKAAKMERAVAHLVKAHAEQDASEALDPNQDKQRAHEERTIATLRKNAGKLRTALATTTERLGAKGTPIKRNITDPESATLKSSHGVVQGYIADGQMRKRDPRYAEAGQHKPASRAKTFLPKNFTFDHDHGTCVCPANQTLKLNSANAIIGGRNAIVFKGTTETCKACALRSQCLRKPDVTAVRQVAFFVGSVTSKLPNPHCRAMREKIDSPEGRTIYANRMGLIEPVFGHIQQRGLRRFTLRGQTKVDTQWKLLCIVHNVGKLQLYGKMAA